MHGPGGTRSQLQQGGSPVRLSAQTQRFWTALHGSPPARHIASSAAASSSSSMSLQLRCPWWSRFRRRQRSVPRDARGGLVELLWLPAEFTM